MAKRLQHRGGTTSQHSTFTGAVREVTVDTDKNTLVVHDGATAGGHPLATATNFTSTGIDDNATSTALTIDSSENVIINSGSLSLVGTNTKMSASSDGNDIVFSFSGTDKARLNNGGLFSAGDGSAVVPSYRFFDDADTGMFRPSANNLAFSTNTSERMRIDSSGNVLVGTTNNAPAQDNVTGVSLRATDPSEFSQDNKIAISFNRKTSDGEILRFRKDGTPIGSIGVEGGNNPYFSGSASNHGGVMFSDAGASQPTMLPVSSGSTLADNSVNIGVSSYRYKDIYLGGGLYVGGTGTANKLDDYEEGTWTPVISGSISGSGTPTGGTKSCKYTKIGNLVYASIFLASTTFPTFSGNLQISLPFTSSSNSNRYYSATTYFYPGANWETVTNFVNINNIISSNSNIAIFGIFTTDDQRQTVLTEGTNCSLSGQSGLFYQTNIVYRV